MDTEELKQEAEMFVSEKADKGNFDIEQFGRAYFSESSMKQALVKFAEKQIAELEAQIEKMKVCQNCMHYRHFTSDVSECAMSFVTSQDCRHNNFYKWEMKNEL